MISHLPIPELLYLLSKAGQERRKKMSYKKEWKGNKIKVVNKISGCELWINGIFQDSFKAFLIFSDKSLHGKTENGDQVDVNFERNFYGVKFKIMFNGEEIHHKYLSSGAGV